MNESNEIEVQDKTILKSINTAAQNYIKEHHIQYHRHNSLSQCTTVHRETVVQ